MPFQDGTGPCSQGPCTGRGLGPCGCGSIQELWRPYRRGFRFRRLQPHKQVVMTEKEEKQILEEQLETMNQEVQEVKKRLKELDK